MKEHNQIDELFRSKLGGFEQGPPSYVWKRIQEKQLGQKRRQLFLYLKMAGVAAAILLAFLFGWQLQQRQKEFSPAMTEKIQENKTEEKATPNVRKIETDSDRIPEERTPVHGQNNPGLASSSGKNKAEGDNFRNSKNESFVAEMTANNDNGASTDQEQVQTNSTENRKQKTEKSQLLRLLDIRLNESFNSRQLVENKSKKSETLNSLELSVINQNAKLLAENRMDKKPGGWEVGAMLTPGYSVNQSSQNQEYASNMVAPGGKEDLQMGGGILVEYKTAKRWSVQSGVYYNKLGQASSNQVSESFDGTQSSPVISEGFTRVDASYYNTSVEVKSGELLLNTSAGVVAIDKLPTNATLSNGFESLAKNEGVLLSQTEFEQNFEYIEVPLILRYQLIDATFDVQLMGGFTTSILVANNAYAKDFSGTQRIGETRDMNTINYGTSIGFGVGYGITNKIRIRVEPQLKYFMGSLSNNSNINFKPYTIGVYTGLSYEF
jgi:hypothetical protein